jgi:hypothetical protein
MVKEDKETIEPIPKLEDIKNWDYFDIEELSSDEYTNLLQQKNLSDERHIRILKYIFNTKINVFRIIEKYGLNKTTKDMVNSLFNKYCNMRDPLRREIDTMKRFKVSTLSQLIRNEKTAHIPMFSDILIKYQIWKILDKIFYDFTGKDIQTIVETKTELPMSIFQDMEVWREFIRYCKNLGLKITTKPKNDKKDTEKKEIDTSKLRATLNKHINKYWFSKFKFVVKGKSDKTVYATVKDAKLYRLTEEDIKRCDDLGLKYEIDSTIPFFVRDRSEDVMTYLKTFLRNYTTYKILLGKRVGGASKTRTSFIITCKYPVFDDTTISTYIEKIDGYDDRLGIFYLHQCGLLKSNVLKQNKGVIEYIREKEINIIPYTGINKVIEELEKRGNQRVVRYIYDYLHK